MGNTRKPAAKKTTAKKATAATPIAATPASAWAGAAEVVEGRLVPLPSGNVARLRAVAPTTFLEGGFLPDPLTQIVRQAINKKSGLKPSEVKDMVDDPEQLVATMQTFDRVLNYTMIEPECRPRPECVAQILGEDGETEVECGMPWHDDIHQVPGTPQRHICKSGVREPGVLYVDMVAMEDKLFIFQWALGGTSDLEQFRKELGANVDALADGQGIRGAAKRTARAG
jgi:hypothetical protein